MSRRTKLGLLIAGLIAFLVVVGFWIPVFGSELAYHSARPCTSKSTSSCLSKQVAVVQSVDAVTAGKSSSYYLTLSGLGQIEMTSDDAAFAAAHVGDTAVATIWRDKVTEVRVRGVTSATQDSPREIFQELTGVLLAALGLLLGAAITVVRYHVRFLVKTGGAYTAWSLVSGVALGASVASGNVWLYVLVPVLSAIVAVLIPVEFFVLQPRIEADRLLEEEAKRYLP